MSSHVVKVNLKSHFLHFERGEGCYTFDDHGKRYLDAAAGVGVVTLGYGIPEFGKALKEQADLIPYIHGMRFSNSTVEQLADKITSWTPDGVDYSFFCSGGSEAMESALKITRQYFLERGLPQKNRFIGRWQSFHGNTLATQSVGGHILRRKPHLPMLINWPHIIQCNCYRCPYQLFPDKCALPCAHDLERVVKVEGAETIAGFIAEPIVGAAGGAPVPPPGYFKVIREICDRHDILFIADEVITGWGRTGTRFGIEHWDVIPDVIVTAKGLSSGYAPLGAAIFHQRIMDVFEHGSGIIDHNFTYAGNPLACRAGLVALDLYEKYDVVENARVRGADLMGRLDRFRSLPFIGDIRGKGLLVGIEFVKDQASKEPFSPGLHVHQWINRIALENGLIVYPCNGTADGLVGDHILLMPPLIISSSEINELIEKLASTFTQFSKELKELQK